MVIKFENSVAVSNEYLPSPAMIKSAFQSTRVTSNICC